MFEFGLRGKGEYIEIYDPPSKKNDLAMIKHLNAKIASLEPEAKKGKDCKADLATYKTEVKATLDKFRAWDKDMKKLQPL